MQHFARLSGTNYPWSAYGAAPEPALTFSVNVKPHTNTLNVTEGGTFGYFCPILWDKASGNYIEYCFVNWQTGKGFPNISHYDELGACATTPEGQNVDTVFSAFSSGQTWSTERAGSTNTFGTIPNNVTQTASITAQNLSNVINQINSADNYQSPPSGCGPGTQGPGVQDSTNAANYEVIGFEDGVEGGGYSTIGESVTNEYMWTTTDALFSGDTLGSNQIMYSSNYVENTSGYKLVMQGDGNLCIYDSHGYNDKPLWCDNASYNYPGSKLVMQADGNLVVYDSNGVARWWSGTSQPGSYVVMQNDGNLVIYKGNQKQASY